MIDDSEFETWYRSVHPQVLATVSLVVGDLYLAQDVVDEAFVRAYDKWQRVQKMESPAGWTYKVAINLLKRWSGRLKREYGKAGFTCEDVLFPPAFEEIWQIVSTLPKRQREVVVFRYIADLTEVQIATVLGVSRGTVSQTLRAAHEKLGKILSESTDQDGEKRCDVTT